MASTSSNSSSSISSSSSGKEESELAMQEIIEANILGIQEYRTADVNVRRAELEQQVQARRDLIAERMQEDGRRPYASYAKFDW